MDHFTRNELADHDITHPDQMDEFLWEERREKHLITVEKYLLKLKPPKSPKLMRRFAMCKAVSSAM